VLVCCLYSPLTEELIIIWLNNELENDHRLQLCDHWFVKDSVVLGMGQNGSTTMDWGSVYNGFVSHYIRWERYTKGETTKVHDGYTPDRFCFSANQATASDGAMLMLCIPRVIFYAFRYACMAVQRGSVSRIVLPSIWFRVRWIHRSRINSGEFSRNKSQANNLDTARK
jgi:hypothetical protein